MLVGLNRGEFVTEGLYGSCMILYRHMEAFGGSLGLRGVGGFSGGCPLGSGSGAPQACRCPVANANGEGTSARLRGDVLERCGGCKEEETPSFLPQA